MKFTKEIAYMVFACTNFVRNLYVNAEIHTCELHMKFIWVSYKYDFLYEIVYILYIYIQ